MIRSLSSSALPWIAAALAILVHVRSLDAGFVYDDYAYIVENADLHGGPARAAELFAKSFPSTAPERALYRPITALTLFADAAGRTLNPARFHATNLMLLALLVLAVHAVLRRVLEPEAAGAGTLLFAVHPAHVEAVAWITGRSELIAALFACGAIAAAIDFARGGRSRHVAIAAAYGFLGCFAKESAATALPLAALACAGAAGGSVAPSASRTRRGRIVRSTIWVGAGVGAALVVRFLVLGRFAPDAGDRVVEGNLFSRLPLVVAATGEHLRLLFVPWPLSVERMPHAPTHFTEEPVLAGAAVMFVWCGCAAWAARRGSQVLAMLLLWPLVALLPVMHFIPIGESVAERFLVLPSVGAAGLLGLFLAWNRILPSVRGVVLGGVVLLAGFASAWRVEDWRSERRLWESAARVEPRSATVWAGLGDAHLRAGDSRGANDAYRRALALDSNLTVARLNRARALESMGDTEGALDESFEAVRRDPGHPVALNHLAARLAGRGRHDEAQALLDRALAISPNYAGALRNAAWLAVERSDMTAARELASRARRADPTLPGLEDLERRANAPSRDPAGPR